MKLFEAIKTRRSIRKYKDKKIPKELLYKILEAASWAPSGGNSQPWKFIIIEDKIKIKKLSDIVDIKVKELFYNNKLLKDFESFFDFKSYAKHFNSFRTAKNIIIVFYKKPLNILSEIESLNNIDKITGEYCSTSMAVQNMILMAHTLKLGCCVYTGCVIAEKEIKDYVKILKNYNLLGIISIGYPEESPKALDRKEVNKIAKWF